MPLALFTDPHIHAWQEFSTLTKEGINSRLHDGLRVIRKVDALARKYECQGVLCGGDWFHVRVVLDVATYNLSSHELEKSARNVPWHIEAGNHDQANQAGTITSVATFANIHNVSVHEHPWTQTIGKHRVSFIPFMLDIDEVRRAFKDARKSDIIIYHGGIQGARTGTIEFRPKEELLLGDIPKQPLILCGHYHKRQQLKPNVWFVGAPMHHNRGDRGDNQRGMVIIGDDLKLKWINFNFPKFVNIVHKKDDPQLAAGNFVDLYCDPRKHSAEELRETYEPFAPRGIRYLAHLHLERAKKEGSDLTATLDYSSLVEHYVKRNAGKLNRKRLRRMANKLLATHD